jgi:hypothetical protein
VNASKHAAGIAVKAAGGIATVLALAAAAGLAARHSGALAGAALISAVFAACWIVRRVRQLLHPARPARNCAPVVPSGNTSPDSAQPDLLPVL